MNKQPTNSSITCFQKSDCSRGMDSVPLSPSRLPSPDRQANYEKIRNERNHFSRTQIPEALPPPPSRFPGHDEGKDFKEVSDKWKNFVAIFPTRVKASKISQSSSPVGTPISRNHKSLSSLSSSFQSNDSIPTPPSRYESPDAKERGTVEMPDQIKKVLVPSLMKDFAMKAAHDAPLDPTVSSHETSVVSEGDVRTTMLSRIPLHIKNQLPVKEWYRILQPSLLREADCSECDSIYSEISHDFLSAATGEIYDDLYGSDDEGKGIVSHEEIEENDAHTRSTKDENKTQQNQDYQKKPLEQDSEMAAADCLHNSCEGESTTQENGVDQMIEETRVLDGASKSSEQEITITDSRRHFWMDAHILAYHTICSTDQESKDHEFEEVDMEDAEKEEPESANDESASPAEGFKKRVSFGSAQVRWHERILDVHPCTSSGPSVGIGWEYTEGEEPIEWERRTSEELRLSRQDREDLIAELGYSARDIAKAVRKTLKIKNQRRRTINNLQANVVNVEKVESVAENVQRKIRKLQTKLRIRKSQ